MSPYAGVAEAHATPRTEGRVDRITADGVEALPHHFFRRVVLVNDGRRRAVCSRRFAALRSQVVPQRRSRPRGRHAVVVA